MMRINCSIKLILFIEFFPIKKSEAPMKNDKIKVIK